MSLTVLEPSDDPVQLRRHAPVVAILVDAENFPAALLGRAMEFAGRIGQVNIRRAFANFEGASGMASWRNGPCATLAITPIHVPTTTQGKNASDIALAMHAMDIAHLKQAEVVCVASSDGDFAMLGHRLREFGITVVGFGSDRAPLAWTAACDRFEALYSIPGQGSRTARPAAAPVAKAANFLEPKPETWRRDDVAPVVAAIEDYLGPLSERAFSTFGDKVSDAIPGFDPRNYGFSKLRLLVESIPSFTVVPGPNGDKTTPLLRRVGSSAGACAPAQPEQPHEQALLARAIASAHAVISDAPDLSPRLFWARVRRDADVTLADLGVATIREFRELALRTPMGLAPPLEGVPAAEVTTMPIADAELSEVLLRHIGERSSAHFVGAAKAICAAFPDFKPSDRGCSSFSEVIRSLPGFRTVKTKFGKMVVPLPLPVVDGPSDGSRLSEASGGTQIEADAQHASPSASSTVEGTNDLSPRDRAVAAAQSILAETPEISPQSLWARVRRVVGITLGDLALGSISEFIALAHQVRDAAPEASVSEVATAAAPPAPEVPVPYRGAGMRDRVMSFDRSPRVKVGQRIHLTEDRIASGIWEHRETLPVQVVVDKVIADRKVSLLSDVSTILKEEIPDFDPRRYGFSKLKDLVGSLPGVEVGMGPKGARNVLVVRGSEHDTPVPEREVPPLTLQGPTDEADPDAAILVALRKDAAVAIAAIRAAEPGISGRALWARVRASEGITLSDVGVKSIGELLAAIDAEGHASDSVAAEEMPISGASSSRESEVPEDVRTTYGIIRSVLNRSTVDAITKAVDTFVGDQPMAKLSEVGPALKAAVPGFDSNILGHAGIRGLVHSLDGFELVPVRGVAGLRIRRTATGEPTVAEVPPTLREIAYAKAREVAAAEPGIDPKRLWLKVRGLAPGVTLADIGFESVRDFLDADEGLTRVGRT